MILSITIIAVIGLMIASYAWYGHEKIMQDKNFKAVCDISDRMSCTKTFTSEYGKFFGMPLGFYGVGFYLTVLVLNYLHYTQYIFYLAILSVVISGVLAYILYFKIKNICLVCNGIYLTNIALLIFSYLNAF
jgi:vitamin-K-epoxide reductase (warfarin-sensitive)